ncbi:thymosin beta isoform X5 [Galleria mellonella]|uniref:Thymosin beta isoform X5 n=1 Tax=Galleria mellonella TaxID=7137 RepID=A0ABM3MUA2_GALME|nr:thymosin beta isoform X5 [Galleria mellonella]
MCDHKYSILSLHSLLTGGEFCVLNFIHRRPCSHLTNVHIRSKMACSVSDTPSLKDLPKVATDLKSQLEGFNTSCLRDVDTNEKIVLPSAEDVATEKNQKSLFDGIEKFDASRLKHTETQEKNPLPDKDAIEAEKEKNKFLNGIENFDPSKLKHTETCEKNPLPTKDVIEQEKTA